MRTNQFPARCAVCKQTVQVGDGVTSKQPADVRWTTTHRHCSPPTGASVIDAPIVIAPMNVVAPLADADDAAWDAYEAWVHSQFEPADDDGIAEALATGSGSTAAYISEPLTDNALRLLPRGTKVLLRGLNGPERHAVWHSLKVEDQETWAIVSDDEGGLLFGVEADRISLIRSAHIPNASGYGPHPHYCPACKEDLANGVPYTSSLQSETYWSS